MKVKGEVAAIVKPSNVNLLTHEVRRLKAQIEHSFRYRFWWEELLYPDDGREDYADAETARAAAKARATWRKKFLATTVPDRSATAVIPVGIGAGVSAGTSAASLSEEIAPLAAPPLYVIRKLPTLKLNEATQPALVLVPVAGSALLEFDPDFVNPIDLLAAYQGLDYDEKLMVIYRMALDYEFYEIAQILGRKDRRTLEGLYDKALDKLVIGLVELDEILVVAN